MMLICSISQFFIASITTHPATTKLFLGIHSLYVVHVANLIKLSISTSNMGWLSTVYAQGNQRYTMSARTSVNGGNPSKLVPQLKDG